MGLSYAAYQYLRHSGQINFVEIVLSKAMYQFSDYLTDKSFIGQSDLYFVVW